MAEWMRGRATTVPARRLRSIRPSAASEAIALFTVIRAQP